MRQQAITWSHVDLATGGFPSQRANNAEHVIISWYHHDFLYDHSRFLSVPAALPTIPILTIDSATEDMVTLSCTYDRLPNDADYTYTTTFYMGTAVLGTPDVADASSLTDPQNSVTQVVTADEADFPSGVGKLIDVWTVLTLNPLNCFKDYKRCIHISYHMLDFV